MRMYDILLLYVILIIIYILKQNTFLFIYNIKKAKSFLVYSFSTENPEAKET